MASSSVYRGQLLARLQLPFDTEKPEIDETPLAGESPVDLVRRLSQQKAEAIGKNNPHALIIGSDQIMLLGSEILGKPGTPGKAITQLQKMSGQTVEFVTGLCLLNSSTQESQIDTVTFPVTFRTLTDEEIIRYVDRENPIDCAGSFKSEALGITLVESMHGDDPTALIGMPLIRLARMFRECGVAVP